MNDRISITICTGTACYVMGASDLLTLENYLSQEELTLICIRGTGCLGLCHEERSKPPFVTIDGQVYSGLNVHDLCCHVRKAIQARRNSNAGDGK